MPQEVLRSVGSCEKMKLVRIVVREDFSRSRCEALLRDLKCESAPPSYLTILM